LTEGELEEYRSLFGRLLMTGLDNIMRDDRWARADNFQKARTVKAINNVVSRVAPIKMLENLAESGRLKGRNQGR
jgi:hypothetical protein